MPRHTTSAYDLHALIKATRPAPRQTSFSPERRHNARQARKVLTLVMLAILLVTLTGILSEFIF